jgi:N-acetyl-anhydromuramyl-L-alanine amidase AmpD
VPSPNHWAGREGQKPIGIVIHTMAGFMAGCDATFKNPATEVSAHYGIGVDGKVHQYVALEDSSWANGRLEDGHRWIGPAGVSPNRLTVTIETEDLNSAEQPVTDAQFAATLAVCRLALKQFPSITHLMTHTVISPNSRANCPGKRWLASGRFQQLADALNLKALV